MAKSNVTLYRSTPTDDDSGIALDFHSSSPSLIRSSPLYNSQSQIISSFPSTQTTILKKRVYPMPTVKYTSDGLIERIRPMTMRNSENGDYIICRTNRGTYVAHRTTLVPVWVTRLVEHIESEQR